jgi:hypothetical protein
MGCNLLPIFGFNFAKCLTFHTSKQQLITLSRTVQSKDCTAASRTRLAHAPPWQHGPRSYPLCSLDSEHSRGKTLVLLRAEAVFGAQIVLPNEFLQNDELSVDTIVKNFPLCMFLLLLCLGTILAPTCPVSCQPSCSLPPSSGSVGAAWFHPFSRFTTAPMRSCAAAPAPSPSVGSRDKVVAISCLKACTAAGATPGSLHRRGRPLVSHPGSHATTKRVSFSDPLVSSPSSSLALPRDGPGTVFLPSKEVFARPGPAVPSQTSHQQASPQRLDL